MKIFILVLLIAGVSGIHIAGQFTFLTSSAFLLESSPTCNVLSMDFSENSTYVLSTNLTSSDIAKVKTIWFYFSGNCRQHNLTFIPKGILNVFPNATNLYFAGCAIATLNSDDLEDIPTLEIFVIYNGDIEHVPGDFFVSTPNIKVAAFYVNKIQQVGEGLFENLQSLERVDFRYNSCINERAWNASQIPGLIENLRLKCPEIETTTLSTTISTTTLSTTEAPRCSIDDFEDFVCGLDEEIENLKETDEILESKVENLTTNLSDQNVEIESLKAQVESLKEENLNLIEKNQNLEERLDEIERAILELTSRPCAC
jgi:hypothetical protein